jgi:hypothetical protein
MRRGAALAAGVVTVLASLLAFAAPARSATTNVTMVGRGWGHGIGMSQWGTYGFAKNGWSYEKILKHYYTGIDLGKVPNDAIRVRLRGGVSSAKVTCTNAYSVFTTGAKLEIPRRHGGGRVGRRPIQGDRRRAGEDLQHAGHLQGRLRPARNRHAGRLGKDRQVPRTPPCPPLVVGIHDRQQASSRTTSGASCRSRWRLVAG